MKQKRINCIITNKNIKATFSEEKIVENSYDIKQIM